MRGIVGRGVLTQSIVISEDARGPIGSAIVDGGSAFPFSGADGFVERFFELLVEAGVEPFDPQLILLDCVATLVPIGIDRTGARHAIERSCEEPNDMIVTNVR